MAGFSLRPATFEDVRAIAQLHRHVREVCLPYLPDLHSPEEDLAYFGSQVFPNSSIWLAEDGTRLIGFSAVRRHWLDHLYVDPARHGQGVGRALLRAARKDVAELSLWTFQRNVPARRFYERQGFTLVELTDGAANEERLPDALYRWVRP